MMLVDLDPVDKEIARLVDCGAIIPYGVTEEGDFMYKFDMDKLEAECPPLYEIVMEETDKDLLNLFDKGLIEVDYDESLNARFKIKGEE